MDDSFLINKSIWSEGSHNYEFLSLNFEEICNEAQRRLSIQII